MILSKKAKCAGCKVLKVISASGNGVSSFSCELGHKMSFTQSGEEAFSPYPEEECYKPTTKTEVKRVRQLISK